MDNPETKQKALLGTIHRTTTNKTKNTDWRFLLLIRQMNKMAIVIFFKTNVEMKIENINSRM